MTDPISPIGGPYGPRPISRRAADEDDVLDAGAEASDDGGSRLPMVIEPPPPQAPPRSRRAALAAFAAQLLGQGGQKRGLRGGRETLEKARTAYLETEWSGPADRRLTTGKITKTEI
ncbi:MAG: hypothetical protein P4L73_09520 [Caulobacteraceae bacterium]|nr:hypothetical protein [Caulobacteraceae bacterium]